MRVLLVEDETRLANAVRRGLEAEGFAVRTASDLWRAGAGCGAGMPCEVPAGPPARQPRLGPHGDRWAVR